MRVVSYPNIFFDPASNALRLTVMGQTLEAKVPTGALTTSKFALPVLVAQLLEPIRKSLAGRWDRADAEEDIASIEADEQVVHEVMAVAFWFATADYNRLESVRRIHFNELERLSKSCLELQTEKSVIDSGAQVGYIVTETSK